MGFLAYVAVGFDPLIAFLVLFAAFNVKTAIAMQTEAA